jgi:cytosine/adenosine deaminase-related metal-dependent hydrolase
MILEADWVLPITSAPISNGAVRVVDGEITDVGVADEVRARYPDEEVTNFHHAVLLPGFVNVHSHLEYSVFRGLFDDYSFDQWLLRFVTARRKLGPAEYRSSALLGAMECVGSGITSLGEVLVDGEGSLGAMRDLGMRAVGFLEVIGMDDSKIPAIMDRVYRRLDTFGGLAGPLVTLGISPHAPYTVSGMLYRTLAEYCADNHLKLSTHVAESRAEVTFVRNGAGVLAHDFRELVGWDDLMWMPTGSSPVQYLQQWGVFSADVLAVHCVQVTPEDIELLKKYDLAIAHCPKSNAKLGCGIAPIGDFLEAGLRVGLGTDSLASNNILDMFGEMRVAVMLHRASAMDSSWLTAQQVLEMATLGGARVLGVADQVGSIEAGKRADLIAVDVEYSHFSPVDDPVSALVYGGNQEDVFFTMIDGRIVYNKKVFQTVDKDEVTRRAQEVRVKLRR